MLNRYNEDRSIGRFLARFPTSGADLLDCWLVDTRRRDGYATFGDRTAPWTGGELYVHRIVWQLVHGPIPDGWEIDHRCHRHACANPLHLEAKPMPENRKRAPWNRKTHCPAGHPYAGVNLYVNPNTGARHCRECMRRANDRRRTTSRRTKRTHW